MNSQKNAIKKKGIIVDGRHFKELSILLWFLCYWDTHIILLNNIWVETEETVPSFQVT